MLRFSALLILLVALSFIAIGCQHAPLPEEPEAEAEGERESAISAAHAKLLEDIREQQETTGSALEDLIKELARERAAAQEALKASNLKRDFAAAKALLVAARRAVHDEQTEEALRTLDRLEAVVQTMLTEVPAGKIRAHLERAAYALQGSAVGVQADVASMELLGALDVALRHEEAPIVPNLARKLEDTKEQVDKGDYKTALASIEEYLATVSEHKSLLVLEKIAAGIRGARSAMERDAGLVVLAELDQLSESFNEFGTMLKAAPSLAEPEVEGAEAEAEGAGAAEAEPEGGPEAAPEGGPAERGPSPEGARATGPEGSPPEPE